MQQIIHLQVSERLLSFFWSNIFYSFFIPRFLFVSPLTLWQEYAPFRPPKSNPAPNLAILHFLVRQPLSFCNFLYSVKTTTLQLFHKKNVIQDFLMYNKFANKKIRKKVILYDRLIIQRKNYNW